jgi:hypothetical protein
MKKLNKGQPVILKFKEHTLEIPAGISKKDAFFIMQPGSKELINISKHLLKILGINIKFLSEKNYVFSKKDYYFHKK